MVDDELDGGFLSCKVAANCGTLALVCLRVASEGQTKMFGPQRLEVY